jgi:hypothetical protein
MLNYDNKNFGSFNYDLTRDQHRLHARIGLQSPPSEIAKCFVTHGESVIGRPRAAFKSEFNGFSVPIIAEPGSRIPVIHMRSGYTQLGLAEWGNPLPSGLRENFRKAERKSIGNPGVIPATHVDMAMLKAHADTESQWEVFRVHPAGELMFIGCSVVPDQFGHARYVIPLVRAAGRYIRPFADWEMLQLWMCASPEPSNFDFIMRKDNGWLQVADSPPVKIELSGHWDGTPSEPAAADSAPAPLRLQ